MVKEANLVSLPFIFKSVPHMFRVFEGEAGEEAAVLFSGSLGSSFDAGSLLLSMALLMTDFEIEGSQSCCVLVAACGL